MRFVMDEPLDVPAELKALPAHAENDLDTIMAILEEGGKFASDVLLPINHSGDVEGCKLDNVTHKVKAPAGFKAAYKQFVESTGRRHRDGPDQGRHALRGVDRHPWR